MRFFALFLAFFGLSAATVFAQLRRVYIFPQQEGIRWNLELDGGAVLDIPSPLFAQTAPDNFRAGGALQGQGLSLSLRHRIRKNALWSLGVELGYLQNGFNNQALRNGYNNGLLSAAGQGWQRGYLLPQIAFRGGKRSKFELSAGLGLMNLSGGLLEKNLFDVQKELFLRQSWDYGWHTAACWGFSLLLGRTFGLHQRWLLFARAGFLQAGGQRRAVLTEIRQEWDPNSQTLGAELSNGRFNVQNPYQVASWQLSLGLRYNFYKTLYPHTRTKDGIIYH